MLTADSHHIADTDGSNTTEPIAFDPFPGSDFEGVARDFAALSYLDSMFAFTRLKIPVKSFEFLLFAMYFPFGVLLMIIRLLIFLPLIGLVSYLCLPRAWHSVILRYELLLLLGLRVRTIGTPSEDARIWLCNHISEFDAVAVRCITDPTIFAYSMYKDMWWLKLTPIRLFKMIYVPQQSRTEGNVSGRDSINQRVLEILSTTSEKILIFPEGGLTNTSVAVMQYHKYMFGLGYEIQPIALKLESPLPMFVDSSYAPFLNNVLCFLFVPYQTYIVDFLPSAEIKPEETSLEFSRRVMIATAHRVGALGSPFLYSDKKKWLSLKRKMRNEGYLFNFTIDHNAKSVQIINTIPKHKVKFGLKKVLPANDKRSDERILYDYMSQQWTKTTEQSTSGTFSHLIFSLPVSNVEQLPHSDIVSNV